MPRKPENSQGTILHNKYRVDDLLAGHTGQAVIFYATDITTKINNKRIVKQFTPNYDNEFLLEVGTRLFKQESEILQKLGKHSQIPQIFDYFEFEKQFYLVQEVIDGQNLEREFATKKQLTELETINFLKDTLDVLSFVHQNGYIHRDIKPSNLIRNKYDQKIYLIDFGAVKEKIMSENIDGGGNFKRTVAIGTNGYMPNEQRNGFPKFSSDIYALGMVAIQAITGIEPNTLAFDEQFNPIWRDLIDRDISNYNPNFLDLLDRMVCGNFQKRYQSVGEVLQNLDLIDKNKLNSSPKFIEHSDDTTVSNSSSDKPQKSLLSWLVAGLSLVSIAFAASFLDNSEKYTDYTNPGNDISLERPENWSVQENWISLQPGVSFLSPLENQKDNFQEQVTISIEKLTQPLTLNDYTAQATAQIENSNTIIEPATSTTFVNKEARKVVFQTKDSSKKLMEVWTIKNKKAYIVTYVAETNKFDKYSKQVEKIITSLSVN